MVRLNIDTLPPQELSDEVVASLTKEFIETGKAVWKKPFIIEKLRELGRNKCCYCESSVGVESKYMEVEHFYCKKKYKNKVVEWANLLPSCKRCNAQKGELDVDEIPIINPSDTDPREHLFLKNYRFSAKTEIGENTRKELNLNDFRQVTQKRFEVGDHIQEEIEKILEVISEGDLCERTLRKVCRKIRAILIECQINREYSATAATALLENQENYDQIKGFICKNYRSGWNDELESLEEGAREIALIK